MVLVGNHEFLQAAQIWGLNFCVHAVSQADVGIQRAHGTDFLYTTPLPSPLGLGLPKELERHTGVDFSKHKTVIRDLVEKWLKFNENKKVARDNRKRAAPAASHAGTKMSEARSRPRVKREPGAEATSVKREQSPEPSVATAQFAAGAPSPITPGRRRSS